MTSIRYRKRYLDGPLKDVVLNPETLITEVPEAFKEGRIVTSLVTGHKYVIEHVEVVRGDWENENK